MHLHICSPCPKCGNTDVSIVSSRPAFAATDLYHERQPVGTDYVFQCPCGCAFTRSVNNTPEHAHDKNTVG